MKIVIYGDDFVYGDFLDSELLLNKDVFFNNSKKKLYDNRWSNLLEKELKIKVENQGVSGVNWQYIFHRFLKNDLESNEENLYIFCPPSIKIKKLIIDRNFNNSSKKLDIKKYNDYNILNLDDDIKDNFNDLLNILFTKNVIDELICQDIISILNYLIVNKKKFIVLPSLRDSVRKSFVFKSDQKNNDHSKIDFFKKNLNFYDQYVFKYIKNIKINNFWCNDPNNILPSGYPNLLAQEKIKNDYIKIINDYNLL